MKKVQVLMSTYNGEKYLSEQIESLFGQEDIKISILVRDDGSTDSTIDILNKYSKDKRLRYYKGKNIGYGRSFLELLKSSDDTDYYAFCDQDDVWEPRKLISAIEKLEYIKNDYKLYFSNLNVVNEDLVTIGKKDFTNMPLTLQREIIRHSASGATMLFNKQLRNIVNTYDFNDYTYPISHDFLVNLVCIMVGGTVLFDENSYIKYRQHNNNVTGISQGLFKRLKYEINNCFKYKNWRQKLLIKLLDNKECRTKIADVNLEVINKVINYRNSSKDLIILLLDRKFTSGMKVIDLMTKLQIIIQCF